MKKGTFIKIISFLFLFFFIIILYLWAYIFPSVKMVNMLKREIKEYSLKINNAKMEKSIFIKGDAREDLLFAECDSEFTKRLEEWKNEKITFDILLRTQGEKAGVSRLKISTEEGEHLLSLAPGNKVVHQNKIELGFIAGLRYGAEFIRVLPLSGQYLLVKGVSAVRSGAYYQFSVIVEQLFTGKIMTDMEKSQNDKKGDLIDMNSPLLKKPVYLTPLKIRREGSSGK